MEAKKKQKTQNEKKSNKSHVKFIFIFCMKGHLLWDFNRDVRNAHENV